MPEQAQALADFLLPMLEYVPERRATAAEMLGHPWLQAQDGGVPSSASPSPGPAAAALPSSGASTAERARCMEEEEEEGGAQGEGRPHRRRGSHFDRGASPGGHPGPKRSRCGA